MFTRLALSILMLLILTTSAPLCNDKHFTTQHFPGGISISIPATWEGLPNNIQEQAETTAEGALGKTAADVDLSNHMTLFEVVQPLAKSYTSIKMTLQNETGAFLSQDEQGNTPASELDELSEAYRGQLVPMMEKVGVTVTEWRPAKLVRVGDNWFYKFCYTHDIGDPATNGITYQYQFHDRDRLVTLTFGTGAEEELMWKPVFEKVLSSMSLLPRPTSTSAARTSTASADQGSGDRDLAKALADAEKFQRVPGWAIATILTLVFCCVGVGVRAKLFKGHRPAAAIAVCINYLLLPVADIVLAFALLAVLAKLHVLPPDGSSTWWESGAFYIAFYARAVLMALVIAAVFAPNVGWERPGTGGKCDESGDGKSAE